MPKDKALFDDGSWWTPYGMVLGHIPADWERIRRSKLRQEHWRKLINRYFVRIKSVRESTGFHLNFEDFNTELYENRRRFYLVVNPNLQERDMFFVSKRNSSDYQRVGWPKITRTKCQIIRTHSKSKIADGIKELSEQGQINQELLQRQLEVLQSIHIQQILSGNAPPQSINKLINLSPEELAEATLLIS